MSEERYCKCESCGESVISVYLYKGLMLCYWCKDAHIVDGK